MWKEVSKGNLLISEPFIKDPAFGRSVILIVEKNRLGTVGFVLNKKLELTLADVLENFPLVNKLFNGGPVAHDSLHFLLRSNVVIKGSIMVLPGLYWGGDFDELVEKVNNGEIAPDDIRFFVGYSGWEPGQLEDELRQNTWAVAGADIKTVFEQSVDKLWKSSMKSLGGEYAIYANSPLDPKLN
jgi:putative transcriptional regulator